MIIHPVLFEGTIFYIRNYIRSNPLGPNSTMRALLVCPIMVIASSYGRFLIATSSSLLVTLLISLAVGFIECALRLSSGRRDWFVMRLFRGREAADLLFKDERVKLLRAELVPMDMIIEHQSIISSSVMQYVFQLTNSSGAVVTFGRLLGNLFGQVLLELLVGFIVAVLEEMHSKVPVIETWNNRANGHKKRFFFGQATVSFVLYYYFLCSVCVPNVGFLSHREGYVASSSI